MPDGPHMLDGIRCGDQLHVSLADGDSFTGEIVNTPNTTGSVPVDDGAVVTDTDSQSTPTGTLSLSFECDPNDVSVVDELLKIKQSFPEDGTPNTPHLYGKGSVATMSYRMQMGDIDEIEVVDDE